VIKKFYAVKQINHMHKFYEARVPVFSNIQLNCGYYRRSDNIKLIIISLL